MTEIINSSISDIIKKKTKASMSTLLYLSIRNFANYKLRSFLTVLGVIIGTMAVFFLASFGVGVHDLVSQQIVGEKSLKVIDVSSSNSKIVKLNDNSVNAIRKYPHIESVGLQYSLPGIISANGAETDTVVYGIDGNYQSYSSINLKKGRLLNKTDNRSVIVSFSSIKLVGIKDVSGAIGKEIKLIIPLKRYGAKIEKISESFTIVGVSESESGSEIYIPSHVFSSAGVSEYNNIKAKIDSVDNSVGVRKQIESGGFETSSLMDTMLEINNIFKFLNLVLIGFGSIGIIVAVLGMFNTLTISLVERTKEIGLMMSLGARRVDVRRLFMFDAVIISMIGSIIGVILAFFAGGFVNSYINSGAKARGVTESFSLFSTPIWMIVSVVGATVIIGLLIAYLPSRRAGKINPIDALRHE